MSAQSAAVQGSGWGWLGYDAAADRLSGVAAKERQRAADERAAVKAKLEANGLEMCCVATSVRMADPDRGAADPDRGRTREAH